MNPQLKAIVFKTARLKETLAFFTGRLGFAIKESSPTHFVIFSEGVRVLFVASGDGDGGSGGDDGGDGDGGSGGDGGSSGGSGSGGDGPSVEFYLGQGLSGGLCVLEDPNRIKIVLC